MDLPHKIKQKKTKSLNSLIEKNVSTAYFVKFNSLKKI